MKSKFGIVPSDLVVYDIKHSIAQNEIDCCSSFMEKSHIHKKNKKKIDWEDFVVIERKSKLFIIWRIGYVIFCLISSYQFTWYATFGPPGSDTFGSDLATFFEGYFIFSIIFNFFLEYEIKG